MSFKGLVFRQTTKNLFVSNGLSGPLQAEGGAQPHGNYHRHEQVGGNRVVGKPGNDAPGMLDTHRLPATPPPPGVEAVESSPWSAAGLIGRSESSPS